MSSGLRIHEISGNDQQQRRLDFANTALGLYNDLLAIGFADTTGQITTLTGSEIGADLPNLAQREDTRRSFNDAKASNRIVIGEVYYFDVVDDWIIPIRVPIKDDTGKLVAVNTSAIAYSKIIENLKSFNFPKTYTIQLVNRKYNTTQVYYPLDSSQYHQLLHKPADFLRNVDSLNSITDRLDFQATSEITGQEVLGTSLSIPYIDHQLVVLVPSEIIWSEYTPILKVAIAIYLLLTTMLSISYSYVRNRQRQYTKEISRERDFSTNIINTSPTLVIGVDTSENCQFVNPAAMKFFGHQSLDLVGKNLWREIFKINQPRLAELDNNKPFETDFEVDGTRKTAIWRAYRSSNQIHGRLLFGVNVSELKHLEASLRQRDANLKSLFESTNSIIGLFDKDLNLIEFNQSFQKYAKVTDNINLYPGIPILQRMDRSEATIFRRFLRRCLNGEKVSETLEYPAPSGSFHFLFNYNPIYDGDNIIGVAMFVEDITELKNSQKQLEIYNQELQTLVSERTEALEKTNNELSSSNKQLQNTIEELKTTQDQLIQSEKMASLGVLSAGIGHEINNPLNFIKNGISALETELLHDAGKVPPDVQQFVDIIQEGVRRASSIVRSLSLFSRSSSVLDEKCNLDEIIDNCLVILHGEFKDRIDVLKQYDEDMLPINGNEGKLHQAFMNILVNASHAIEDKGEIRIETKLVADELKVTFEDSGTGIDPEDLKRIADPFFTTKPPGEGTGLGLYITYAIVEEHGGTIEIQSEKNKGTTVSVKFKSSPHRQVP